MQFLNQSSTETYKSPIKMSSPPSNVCSKYSYEFKYAHKCITLELYIWINITEMKQIYLLPELAVQLKWEEATS